MAFDKAMVDVPNYFFSFSKYSVLVAVSFVLMFVAHRINYNYYARISLVFFQSLIPLLAIPLFCSADLNDASRSLRIPV